MGASGVLGRVRTSWVAPSALACCLLLCAGDAAWARAGGGGSRGGTKAIAMLVMMPFIIAYAVILQRAVRERAAQAEALLRRLAASDPAWSAKAIEARVRETFFKVQHAWTKRDQEEARAYMTDALYREHKMQTDQMIRDHQRNMLSDITLSETSVIGVNDSMDDTADCFWVWMQGSMIDYVVDTERDKVIRGEQKQPTHFHEIWRFDRSGDTWLLAEIKQANASGLSAVKRMRAVSTSLGAGRSISVVGSKFKR